MNKNIVFITHALAGGGSERVLTLLANYFATRGYNVTILSRVHHTNHYFVSKDVNIIYLETKHHLSFIVKARKYIKQVKASNVISFEYFYNMCASIACWGLGVNLIVSERNDPKRVGGSMPKKQIRNFLYRFVDSLICQTDDAKKFFPDYIQKKSAVILNPLSDKIPDAFTGERTHMIVNFCRLNKQKNIPLLIDSFEEFISTHDDYKLCIYGDGPEKDSIERLILRKGLSEKVFLKGNTPNVLDIVKDCMMFVSTSDYEGLSNSMLEAMAVGLPVICTDCPCGGARMVIDGNNGVLTQVGNKEQLVVAMKRFAEDYTFRKSCSINASKIREKLSMDCIGLQWESFIKE